MPKTYPVRNSFNSGEISGLVSFRDDLAKYASACLTLENAVPLVEGGAKKMPGTYFAGATALGGAMFTGSISGTTLTVTAVQFGVLNTGLGPIIGASPDTTITALGTGTGGVGTYTVNNSQTVASRQMQIASSGKSRLVPFQFSTIQGAILEFSAGIIRIWEGASQGQWSLGLAIGVPSGLTDYNPATPYVVGNQALVGPYFSLTPYFNTTILGELYIAAPYGTSNATTVPITLTVNTVDSLSVTIVGTSPNQGINIALANATSSKNTADLIQVALRALGSLNSSLSNYVDLSAWTVTPDSVYYATPIHSFNGTNSYWTNASLLCTCVNANQYDRFPVDPAFWSTVSESGIGGSSGPGSPIELSTPYLESDLFALDCSTQSADVLWIFHPNYPPAVVERLAANIWRYSLSLPGQQPGEPAYRGTLGVVKTGYSALGQNISLISQVNPCVVVLASSSTSQPFSNGDRVYINLCSGMVELNQGEFIVAGINYGSVTVTLIDSSGTITTITTTAWNFVPVDAATGGNVDASGFLQYQGGGFAVKVVPLFAAAGDYPACGTLYQERLCVGGSDNNPTQINGSVEDDYPDFICDPNEEDYAFQFTLVSNQVNQLLNMIGTPNALLIGTSGGVWVVDGSTGSSLSQTNVNASLQTSMGVSSLQPQLINSSAIFVSRSARIVLFLVFDFASNQWNTYDLTRLNRVITLGPTQETSGLAQTAFQIEPYPILWAVRNDGQLIGLVFNTQDQVQAWFRVNMGAGLVESVAVISGQNQEDQVVVVVNRTINGVTQRYVEYFMPQEIFSQLSNAFFVNCGQQLQLLPSANITGITNANPPVVTAQNHGFSSGQYEQIIGVNGMVSPTGQSINQDKTQAYTITVIDANHFSLNGMDTTLWTPYLSGGSVIEVTNQVTGLSYLLGQEVTAVGDGALILPPTEVTADSMTFPYYCNLITIGIPYQVTVQPTNPVLSQQGATTRGMKQKLNRVTISLYESMGGMQGTDPDHMYPITYGPGTQLQPPGLSTGEFTRDMDADWGDEDTFFITQSDPFPFTLRGLIFRLTANQD